MSGFVGYDKRLLFFTTEYAESVVAVRAVIARCFIITIATCHFSGVVAIETARYVPLNSRSPFAVKVTTCDVSSKTLAAHIPFITTVNITCDGFGIKVDIGSKRAVGTVVVACVYPVCFLIQIAGAEVQDVA